MFQRKFQKHVTNQNQNTQLSLKFHKTNWSCQRLLEIPSTLRMNVVFALLLSLTITKIQIETINMKLNSSKPLIVQQYDFLDASYILADVNNSLVQIDTHDIKQQLQLQISHIKSHPDNDKFVCLLAIMEDSVLLLYLYIFINIIKEDKICIFHCNVTIQKLMCILYRISIFIKSGNAIFRVSRQMTTSC